MIEIVSPKDRAAWLALRGKDVTASVVGALFHEHEFVSTYELWALKSGRLSADTSETPAMQRGRLLERVAVDLLRERHPDWAIEHNATENTYYRDPDARIGATPDVIVDAPGRGRGVVQVKSVEATVYRRKWLAHGEPEPPFWIVLQAITEAHLVGADWAAVAPLVVGHGLEMPLIDIPLTPGVWDAIKQRTAAFWAMVESGQEPTPDFGRDGGVIDRLFADGDEYEEIDLSGDNRVPELIARRTRLKDEIKACEAEVKAIDAEVKAKIGSATIAHLGDGRRVTWKTVARKGYVVEPTTFRQLRYPTGG